MSKMKNGRLFKEKWEFFVERFKTRQGLFDFFIGTAIWGYIFIAYADQVFNFFKNIVPVHEWVQLYIGYLGLGITFSLLGIGVTWTLMMVYNKLGLNKI